MRHPGAVWAPGVGGIDEGVVVRSSSFDRNRVEVRLWDESAVRAARARADARRWSLAGSIFCLISHAFWQSWAGDLLCGRQVLRLLVALACEPLFRPAEVFDARLGHGPWAVAATAPDAPFAALAFHSLLNVVSAPFGGLGAGL